MKNTYFDFSFRVAVIKHTIPIDLLYKVPSLYFYGEATQLNVKISCKYCASYFLHVYIICLLFPFCICNDNIKYGKKQFSNINLRNHNSHKYIYTHKDIFRRSPSRISLPTVFSHLFVYIVYCTVINLYSVRLT